MSLGRYSILVLGVMVATLGLAWPFALRRLDAPARWAVTLGAAIAALNTTAAHALLRWSAGRPMRDFLRAVLGGMIVRLALMVAALVAGFLLLQLPRTPLAVSLLAYFVLFLTMELTIAHHEAGPLPGAAR